MGRDRDPFTNIFGVNGLAENQNYLFLNNIFLPVIIESIDA